MIFRGYVWVVEYRWGGKVHVKRDRSYTQWKPVSGWHASRKQAQQALKQVRAAHFETWEYRIVKYVPNAQ